MFRQMFKFFKKENKDYSLESGERQVADKIENIREDHLARYRLVKDYLDLNHTDNIANAMDIFCGNGYGTYMLSQNFKELDILGIDGSKEAVDLANEVYKLDNNSFKNMLFPFKLEKNVYDLIVCFESLEHVKEDKKMFDEMVASAKIGALIFVSVPNDNCHSLEKNPHKFHFRHYKHDAFLQDFQNDLVLLDWFGQDVYEFEDGVCKFQLLSDEDMQLKKHIEGQVNIYVFKKS